MSHPVQIKRAPCKPRTKREVKRRTRKLIRRLWKTRGEDAPTRIRQITQGYW